MTLPDPDPHPRGSAELWLKAAYETLLEGGVDAVRILPLAQKVNLSRASFYWSFKTRDELLAALLSHWARKNTEAITSRAAAYADSLPEALLNVSDCWFSPIFDDRLELAIRSWALQSREVLDQVRKLDDIRLQALKELFLRFGVTPQLAEVRARSMYLVQIGYIAMQTDETMELRLSRLPAYIEAFGGIEPDAREMLRFLSRNGFAPQAG